jgi:dephospho-CoA kinase
MSTIGLTGNFGMGQSSVLKMFGEMGAFTYDIDTFVHSILEKPAIIKKMTGVLGSSVLLKRSGRPALNKKRVASIIFNDPAQRKAIEKIIHPEVLKSMKQTEAKVLKNEPMAMIVFEVPLLFEAGYERHFDKTVVVYAGRQNALNRLEGKGFTKDEALDRMRIQMPISTKMKRSDYTINNNYSLQRTEKRVKKIMLECLNV